MPWSYKSMLWITLITLQLFKSCTAKRYRNSSRQISFRVDDDIPEECRNQQYCTIKPNNYPQQRFDDMFLSVIPLHQPSLVIRDPDADVDPNILDDVCAAHLRYVTLFAVKGKLAGNPRWYYVVQSQQKNYHQMVRVETCKRPNGACFRLFENSPYTESTCVQHFTTWDFIVEDVPGKTMKQSIQIASCCSCGEKIRPVPFLV